MKFRAPTDEPVHLALTTGHTCIITAEGIDIDPRFHRAAIAANCIPVGIEVPQEPPSDQSLDRAKALADGIRQMLDSDDDGMFTANGRPNATKLASIVGFKPDREEVDAAWAVVETELTGKGGGA
jgi:hypothetical protein